MAGARFSWDRLHAVPIVGIARNISIEDVTCILPLYRQAGLTTIEITMNTPDAEKIIRHAGDRYADDLNVGAGTVCDLDDLNRALDSGAQFIVTPICDEDVIAACVRHNVPVFPGAYTPSEVYRAWRMGAGMVKIFPAGALGPSYVREIKAPLDRIRLMPTGGVSIDNCLDFFKAGADALGIGSQLLDRPLIRTRNWKALAGHFEMYVQKINTRKV